MLQVACLSKVGIWECEHGVGTQLINTEIYHGFDIPLPVCQGLAGQRKHQIYIDRCKAHFQGTTYGGDSGVAIMTPFDLLQENVRG